MSSVISLVVPVDFLDSEESLLDVHLSGGSTINKPRPVRSGQRSTAGQPWIDSR